MAKLSFREIVHQSDVDEAIKLMDFSIRSLRNIKAETKDQKKSLGKKLMYNNIHYSERLISK